MFKLGVAIPVALPIGETAAELEPYQSNLLDQFIYMVTKPHAGENI